MGLQYPSFSRIVEAAETRALDRIGVQLYTVRSLMEMDFEGTLEAVAKIGFHEVEFHDYFGRQPREVKNLLDRLGLEAPASHFPWDMLRNDPEVVLETAKTIGHHYIILAWVTPEERTSIEQYKDLAAFCNKTGEACKDAGLQFAYHNHDFEFHPIDGQIPFDLLLAETDPDLVEFEIDLYWITKGGREPLEYFEKHSGRFPLCHVKDMGEDGGWANVGAGRIDFPSIFARAEQVGLKYFFVEHDEPADPLGSIAASFNYLEALTF